MSTSVECYRVTVNRFYLLPCAESAKVVDSLWTNIGKELHDNPANRDPRNGHVKKDPWSLDPHSEGISNSEKDQQM